MAEVNAAVDERQELVDIYNNLSEPLKRQLLTLARVIDTTMEIALSEGGGKKRKAKTSIED